MKIQHNITDFPPFNTLNDERLKTVINNEFWHTTVQPYTLIMEKNKQISQIGYICSGTIELFNDMEDRFMTCHGSIGKGDYFGIEALFNKGVALFDELSTEYVECFTIEKETFIKIISENAELKTFFENILFERLRRYLCSPSEQAGSRQAFSAIKQGVRLNRSITYIDSNYADNISLDDLAKEIGLSRFHTSRMFKNATGHTFKEYLNMRRLKAAKKLMRTPELNISQVCYSVGFNDVSYFSRIFKKYEGMNPSTYRKQLNAEAGVE